MTGDLVRVRIDLVHTGDTNYENDAGYDERNSSTASAADASSRADLALPTSVPMSAMIPEVLRIFDVTPQPGRFVSWRFQNARGEVLYGDETLNEAGILDGDRLLLIDDPGPVPPPTVLDIADKLADLGSTTRLTDAVIGHTAALITSFIVAISLLFLAAADSHLAAAVNFVLMLLAVAGLRIALLREGSSATIATLGIQVVVFGATCSAAFIGIPINAIAADWRPIAAVAVTAIFLGAALIAAPAFVEKSLPGLSVWFAKKPQFAESRRRPDELGRLQ